MSKASGRKLGSSAPRPRYFKVTRPELMSRLDAEQQAEVSKELETWPMTGDTLDVWVIPTAWRVEWKDQGNTVHACLLGKDPQGVLASPGEQR
jgi:hypothetical protein